MLSCSNKFLKAAVPYVPWTEGQKKSPSEFNHPGLWDSHDDLETIRTNVADAVEPWKSVYDAFADDSYSKSS